MASKRPNQRRLYGPKSPLKPPSKPSSPLKSLKKNASIGKPWKEKPSLSPSQYTKSNPNSRSYHQSKKTSFLHESARNSPVEQFNLYKLYQTQPPLKLMKQWIREAFDAPEMSPTLVDKIIDALAAHSGTNDATTQDDPDQTAPEVVLPGLQFAHISGFNDLMTGTNVSGSPPPALPDNDALCCVDDFYQQVQHMPWRVRDARSLGSLPDFFMDKEDCIDILGPHFLITNLGVWRAVEDVRNMLPYIDSSQRDTLVLGALARRGGRRDEEDRRAVFYPENMHPILWEQSGFCDREYWDLLYSRGDTFLNDLRHAFGDS